MSQFQKFITSLVPRSWAASMEAESRQWMARCEACGHERSIWDSGGIRWKAAGNPRRLMRCPQCGKTNLHTIQRHVSN
jgi:hypothetical protein